MSRALVALASTAAVLAGLASVGSATAQTPAAGRTVMSVSASATSIAFISEKRVVRMRRADRSVAITYTATEVVRPYTYDADINKVYAPDVSQPIVDSDGFITIDCRRKGQPWYAAEDVRITFVTGTTTVRLPLRRAYQCRFSIYVSASGDFAIGQDQVGVSLAATLVVR